MSNLNITGNLNIGGEVSGPAIDALKQSGSKPMVNLDIVDATINLNDLVETNTYFATTTTRFNNRPDATGGHVTIFVNRGEDYTNSSNDRSFCQLSQIWADNSGAIYYRDGYIETTEGANQGKVTWYGWATKAIKKYTHNITMRNSKNLGIFLTFTDTRSKYINAEDFYTFYFSHDATFLASGIVRVSDGAIGYPVSSLTVLRGLIDDAYIGFRVNFYQIASDNQCIPSTRNFTVSEITEFTDDVFLSL